MQRTNPLITAKQLPLTIGLLLSFFCASAQKPRLTIQETPVSVNAINTQTLTNARTFSIDNLTETIYRDAGTNAPILRELKYDFAKSGGGMQRDLIYFNKDHKPSYAVSVNTNANGLTTDAIEEVEVLKGKQGQIYGNDPTAGVVNLVYNIDTKKYENRTPVTDFTQLYAWPAWKPTTTLKNDDWTGKVKATFKLGTYSESKKETVAGIEGQSTHNYQPFPNFTNIQTEKVEFKDISGQKRADVYREYYLDGFMFEEITYYDCNGKPTYYESSVYDEFGDEWEYVEITFNNGEPVGGFRDIWTDDLFDPAFRQYYNPETDEFEDEPDPTELLFPKWSQVRLIDDIEKTKPVACKDDSKTNFKGFLVFLGPSLILEDYSKDEKLSMWGVDAQVTYNFNSKWGATIDLGYNWAEKDMTKYSKFNILGGVTWTPCSKMALDDKFTFNVQALGGMQTLTSKYDMSGYSSSDKTTDFTALIGPRIDYRLSPEWYIGAGAYYNPVFAEGNTANNYKFQLGVRYSFGGTNNVY